jgi:hypothetical protein
MKTRRVLVICFTLILLIGPLVRPDSLHTLFVPLAVRAFCADVPPEDCDMGYWSIVVPEEATNKTLNPSAETTGNFANVGGAAAPTRITSSSHFGNYAYSLVTTADNEGMTLTLDTLANAIHYVTVRIETAVPFAWDWSLDDGTYNTPTLIDTYGSWLLYGFEFPAAQANGSTLLYIRQNGVSAGPHTYVIDAIQVEEAAYWTTYVDGDQEGCEWAGAEHASASTRSALSRAGGRVRDLQDAYGFRVERMSGVGATPQDVLGGEFATLPGGEVSDSKIHPRQFVLSGLMFSLTSFTDLLDQRRTLLNIVKPESYPETEDGPQPVLLYYTIPTTTKQIQAHYEAGLEGNFNSRWCAQERLAIRWLADDPYFYGIGEESVVLDTNDTATLRQIAGRTKSSGQWSALGVTAAGTIRAVLRASSGLVYYAGTFGNFNGNAGWDNIVSYNPSTSTWAIVGSASDINGLIRALAEGPDGTIYAGGLFTNAGGDANADYIAQYDPPTNTWSAVGIPLAGAAAITSVLALAFTPSGDLIAGGQFTDFANDANADYIALWDGSAWSTPGGVATGGTGVVNAIGVTSNGDIYIGGTFVNWNGDGDADRQAWFDDSASTWASVGAWAISTSIDAIAVYDDDRVVFGGNFLDADGVANADYIFIWNGQAVSALSTGMNNAVSALKISPDGILYATGVFFLAGGIDANRIARWNGSSWVFADIAPPSTTIFGIDFGHADPVIASNYDQWVGSNSAGAGTFAGTVTETYVGTAPASLRISFNRSGGTSATIKTVRNETVGTELLMDYDLLDAETLTVNTHPQEQTVMSDFFGSRQDAVLKGSDFGNFALSPNRDNQITSFVDVAGAPTITAFATYRVTYDSAD